MTRLTTTLEAILYLKAQPMTIAQLAELAGFDRQTTEEGLMELMSDYAHRDGALEIAETDSGYSLQLRETYQNLINALIPADLGVGALRTLAVIALKGPISQTELVEIRGSGVYQHIPELVELGFVRKRKNSDGRSSLVQVTDKFHQYFQINQDIGQLIQKKPKPEESVAAETVEEVSEESVVTEPDRVEVSSDV
ncbi:SMC-Scp complex subunit ScpB [Leptolyngbya sp. GGD]|uniref:SMC-Scp complex subunit ScpB n=1 Tax=Leptolyngbya sp. GGD TaxID=2997907 RepID=UPI00227B65EA|nr:SMC-Scp complex subunit ScpB [Leptolyngbya sp. GGD]MCY6493209.1 SMC-Scp complex subunit ScpB [Leptolyngbya sp. GGD]